MQPLPVRARSPRFAPQLAKQLAAWGGVRWVFLTHRDDVADAARWAAHFGAQRIIHEADVTRATADAEHILRGSGPWALPHAAALARGDAALRAPAADDDVVLLHVPGHTAGSCALLHRRSASLFTGDHLAFSAGLGRLTIFRAFNWYSVEQQLASAAALEHIDWRHLLPGHGRRVSFDSAAAKNAALHHLLAAERGAAAAAADG
jgi:glyoxylase-like metal-dependent hydrolase (beta-lactamase superfamily II)